MPFNLFDETNIHSLKPTNSFSESGSTELACKGIKEESRQEEISQYEETSMKTKRKLFKVKKYVEYDEILKEIYSENEENYEDISKTKNKLLNRKRFTLRKKDENFSKLSQKEKVEKLSQLSKLVKRYRRKYTCLQSKIKNNISKIFQKYLFEKLKINYKNKYLNHNLNLDLFQVVKSFRKLNSAKNLDYSDQKHVLETLVNVIADNKIPFDSINFKKLCTQVRLLLPKEKIKYINKKGSQITIQFPEREVKVTKTEYNAYHDYINNNEILRKIFGIERQGTFCQSNQVNGNNIQLIPVITVPMFNLPAFQEMLAKGGQQKVFLLGGNDSMMLPYTNTTQTATEKSIDTSFDQQQGDTQNNVLNTFFLLDERN